MRINKEYIKSIKRATQELFGHKVKVYLFGSRANDHKKGGDIDLYIETEIKENVFEKKLNLIGSLHKALGEQKIDIVINNFTHHKHIFDVAKSEGILL